MEGRGSRARAWSAGGVRGAFLTHFPLLAPSLPSDLYPILVTDGVDLSLPLSMIV
jgi:hypothetical protein